MAGYIGSKASVVSSGAERKKVFAITTTTTSLTGLTYTPTKVHVYHNGIRLVDGTDYTATNGTSITLNSAAESGDEVVVVSYATFQVADAYTQAEADAEFVQVTGDTMTGALIGTDLTLSGGVYLGGTGSANKLDDYEEGTWTPNIRRFDGTVAASFNFSGATYVKMGRLVTIKAYIYSVSAGSSNGSSYWTIYGVPFLGNVYSGVAMAYNSTQANTLYIGDAGGNIIFTNNNLVYSGSLSGNFMLNLTYETTA